MKSTWLIIVYSALMFLASCSTMVIKESDITSKNVSAVEQSLKQGALIDAKTMYNAVMSGNIQMVQLMIKYKADPNTIYDNYSVIGWAACNRDIEMVKYLSSAGAHANPAENKNYPPLALAATGGSIECVKFLMSKGADAKSTANFCLYSSVVIFSGNSQKTDSEALALAKIFIDAGADVNIHTSKNVTPLHFALWNGFPQTAIYLIDKGANVNAMDSDGETPVMAACSSGYLAPLQQLAAKGANLDARSKNGVNALYMVFLKNDKTGKNDAIVRNIVKYLLSKNVAADIKSESGLTPLHLAAINGFPGGAKVLLDKKADINAKTNDGMTPLMEAADYAQPGIVKLLLDKGAAVDETDLYGRTAVFFAVTTYSDLKKDENMILQILQMLVAKGAKINYAVEKVKKTVSTTVEGQSVTMTIERFQGYTPLIQAVDTNLVKVADYLISKGADINAKESLGLTPLMITARNGDTSASMAKMLLAKGADTNKQNNTGWTALMICCQYNSFTIADYILDKGSDLSLKTAQGSTVLKIAQQFKHDKLVEKIKTKAGK